MNVICLDLLPSIIEFIPNNSLKCLHNVSPHIDRVMRSLKRYVFFGSNNVTYNLSYPGSIIIKLKSGKCVGLTENCVKDIYITYIEKYGCCYRAEIRVFPEHDDNQYSYDIVDLRQNIMMGRNDRTYVIRQYDKSLVSECHRQANIFDESCFGRFRYIDMNTCCGVGWNEFNDYYYESFVVVYKNGQWQ